MKTNNRAGLTAMLLAIVCASPIGCGRGGTTMSYTLGRKNDLAVLTVGKLTVIFEGVPFKGPDAAELASGFVQVSGSGKASGQSGVNEVKVAFNYANGVQRMSVGAYQFDILNNGRTIKFGDQTVDATRESTIVVKKDGTTSVIR
jgi:hypothetical protein